jgi:palmitoyl-protein thioesterase
MRNLISLGGPQQGVHSFPRCNDRFGPFCGVIQGTLNSLAYTWLQGYVTPATYWHDTNEKRYVSGSTFLALINNEKTMNWDYVANLQRLNKLVLVKYQEDKSIVPNESSWFGYMDKDKNEYPLEASRAFDNLNLRSLKEKGTLVRLISPGIHLSLDPVWFASNIIPYFE